MKTVVVNLLYFIKGRAFQMLWISLVVYSFYDTFIYYQEAPQFYHLRNMLGAGLYISRGTASVLNISCALVLLPLCKKLNKLLYRMLSQVWPGLFFFWLERAKSFHMTIAITLVLFAVIHSISHFANLWNFSRYYNDEMKDINFAKYKNEFLTITKAVEIIKPLKSLYQSPVSLLLTQPGVTGVAMLLITSLMGLTSLRAVRRKCYNAFWYTHHLYLPFMMLLIVHPLSGALKEQVLKVEEGVIVGSSNMGHDNGTISSEFVAIQSKTWLWMSVPLSCFFIDLMWRTLSRNRARVEILEVHHMAGRTIGLNLSCPSKEFKCHIGQYVLLQALDISLIEWHPFTVVKLPTSSHRNFMVWIRVTGDWTEGLERLLLEKGPKNLTILVDGPYTSAMQGVCRSGISICVAAGVGITPFVAVLQDLLLYPRNRLPGRVHLIWIVRHEHEISWLADLATKTIQELRNSNRPDRLHIELYVTNSNKPANCKNDPLSDIISHVVAINENGCLTHSIIRGDKNSLSEDEKMQLLTPNLKRSASHKHKEESITRDNVYTDNSFKVAEKFPLLGCRVKKGRPQWNRIFTYWAHLYPGEHLSLYCCGPKKIVKQLRNKSNYISKTTSTSITFVSEGFS